MGNTNIYTYAVVITLSRLKSFPRWRPGAILRIHWRTIQPHWKTREACWLVAPSQTNKTRPRATTTMADACEHETGKGDGLTAAEIQRLGTALQNQEFRDLLLEYAQEIANPENRAQYEADVLAVERARGYDVTFVRPEPHYVFKTTVSFRDSQREAARTKAFVNVCQSEAIEKPSCKRVSPAIARSFCSQESELLWTVPHSLTYPRDDTDKRQGKCIVYDCVYHPDTLRLAGSNKHFKKMVEEIAIDAVENSFGVQLDRTHLKYPKMKVKGAPVTTILRKKIEPSEMPLASDSSTKCPGEQQEIKEGVKHAPVSDKMPAVDDSDHHKQDLECEEAPDAAAVVPEYVIKHRHRCDLQDHALVPVPATKQLPSELVIEIKLPAIDSSSSVCLELKPDRLTLASLPGLHPHYALDLKLPYAVDEAGCKAKFCTELHVLSVELPVLVPSPPAAGHLAEACGAVGAGSAEHEGESLSRQMSELEIAEGDDQVKPLTDAMKELSTVDCGQADLKYMLPEFSCHQSSDELIFVLKIRNVAKDSVRIQCMDRGAECSMMFSSIGAGACPFHYSIFLKFTEECRIAAASEQVSVTEENAVIILVKHEESKHCWEEFNYGVDSTSATFREVFALNALQRKLHVLQTDSAVTTEALQNASKDAPPVKITEVSSERFTFEIDDADQRQPHTLANGSHRLDDETDSSKPGKPKNDSSSQMFNAEKMLDAETKPETTGGVDGTFGPVSTKNDINANGYQPAVRPFRKVRSLSGSCDDRSPVNQPRSILKLHLRSRHLSESSDDACWSSQEYSTAVDLDIPEEGSLENLFQARKSVHFNDKIYRSFFRSNSSILGQRRKNQRKERKKRDAFRRSSESECSETETDNAAVTKPSLNKNILNMNSYQHQNVCTANDWDCLASDVEIVTGQNLDNRDLDGLNGNCEDARNGGKARKNKSRRRKKRSVRKSSDSEGNSSDGQQQLAYKPQSIGVPFRDIEVY